MERLQGTPRLVGDPSGDPVDRSGWKIQGCGFDQVPTVNDLHWARLIATR